jgi:hypothetical protein
MNAETNRHAGHADIVRELIDNSIGVEKSYPTVASTDPDWWEEHHARLDAIARAAGGLD